MEQEEKHIDSLLQFLDKSISSFMTYKNTFLDPSKTSKDIYKSLFEVEYIFPYINFNTNTIRTLESTGEIKHLSPQIREALIDLDRDFDNMLKLKSANNQIYLERLLVAGELGLNNLPLYLKKKDDLKQQIQSEYNLAKMIITADAAYTLKNFTEYQLRTGLLEVREKIDRIRKLVIQEME